MAKNTDTSTGVKRGNYLGGVAFWSALLTAGIIALALGYDADRKGLMPGPLTPAHRVIADCAACHSSVGKGRYAWVSAIFAKADAHADSTRCISCHSLGDTPNSPHGLPAERLKKEAKKEQPQHAPATDVTSLALAANELLDATAGAVGGSQTSIGCATCHGEHRHADNATSGGNDRTCNACHQARFASFQNGHPDFSNNPFRSHARIRFDHAKHFGEHFEKTRTKQPDLKFMPKACTDCHEASDNGQVMKLKSFGETCSSCHLPQIVGADRATGPKGVALLTLPGLDLATLRDRKSPIGIWPEESEAELSPLMRVLLARDPKRRSLLVAIEKLDLLNLDAATDTDLTAVTGLVWEIKELLNELTTSKVSNILQRIRTATGSNIAREEITRMLGTLPREVLNAAVRDWLPSLSKEVARRQQPGWQQALRPKTKEHGTTSETQKQDKKEAEPKPQTKLVNNPKGGRWYVSVLGDIVQEGLEPAETRDAARGEIDKPHKAAAKPVNKTSSKPSNTTLKRPRKKAVSVDDETWSEYGGWYRKDYAVLYRPSGHADGFLRAWLDFSAAARVEANSTLLAPVFELLTHKDAQGRCTKCHNIESSPDGGVSIAWGVASPSQKKRPFTLFSHAPHLSILDKQGCMTCHELNKSKKPDQPVAQSGPKTNVSNFKPIAKAACVVCHSSGRAPQDCGQCHTYHVAATKPPMTPTRLPVKTGTKQ